MVNELPKADFNVIDACQNEYNLFHFLQFSYTIELNPKRIWEV